MRRSVSSEPTEPFPPTARSYIPPFSIPYRRFSQLHLRNLPCSQNLCEFLRVLRPQEREKVRDALGLDHVSGEAYSLHTAALEARAGQCAVQRDLPRGPEQETHGPSVREDGNPAFRHGERGGRCHDSKSGTLEDPGAPSHHDSIAHGHYRDFGSQLVQERVHLIFDSDVCEGVAPCCAVVTKGSGKGIEMFHMGQDQSRVKGKINP